MDKQEGLKGLPNDCHSVCTRGGWPDGPSRRLLKAMSLVCREWNKLAQDALQRRIFLSGENQLEGFQTSRSCGPWVRELQYWHHDRRFVDDPIEILSSMSPILCALPALVALSIGGKRIMEPLDIARYLSFLSSAPHLRTLHIQCPLGSQRIIQIYEAISNLHHLETLSLIGTWDEGLKGKSLTRQLRKSHPPASPRRLLFRVKFSRITAPAVRLLPWLLQARGDYALHELRLVLTELKESHEPILMQAMCDTLPHLKTLQVLLGDGRELSPELCEDIVKRCTSLKELHLCDDPSYALPTSLERFCWGHDHESSQLSKVFSPLFTPERNDKRISNYLRSQLNSTNAPSIRSVHVCSEERSQLFYETQRVCAEFQIEFVLDCNL